MATIQIRDLPDDVYDELRRQAKSAGQSLQAYMHDRVTHMTRMQSRKAAMLAELDGVLQQDGGRGIAMQDILADLDAGRDDE